MNIEEFVSEDNHMCNLCGDLFYKILAQSVSCRKFDTTFRRDLRA